MNIKEKIINISRELFLSSGFSGTTVEDISSEFGMSKKTFYKIFTDKKTLLRVAIFSQINMTEAKVSKILADRKTPLMERFKRLSETLIASTLKITPVFIRDMKKNAPELWEEVSAKRKNLVLKYFTQVVDEGIESGVIRSDLDKKLVIIIYLAAIENVINPQVLSEMEYSVGEVFDVIITMMFQGVLTDKGRKNLKELKKASENNKTQKTLL
ncbi:MAG: hypothetical protein A2452_04615 [Candidatus Firestonebacteria bacterium RIFOXYC2_FULL_39_67]|nr:MAG: hypothetical protein A2536_11585 [Candidatus Firestonebacteria bacterium RIFOXYD2_FULL_39_29]OGF55870.1 MAG: hypothetical protein A2452_04615 [Candidatus Firestonebacteria bacterium RIFOXYC2_FULL_39_67]OGF57959.1 MAG: hypothetical protein A2497_02205 [Candidatus Firestonebacteria bacterium RifOxyC12_full_39_7]